MGGYGDDGMVNWGDIQTTAVSGDGPDWFVGSRTVAGPLSTKTVPVRRHPYCNIEGKQMLIRGKTFETGPHLESFEPLHDSNIVPMKPERPAMKMCGEENKAKYCSLIHGGVQTKPNPL